jgi:hypothetical protein
MPPKGLPQPGEADRKQVADWIGNAFKIARLRPAPKNGLVRRLTVAQYRNTLRELLQIKDDLTGGLPPDVVSKDGFVNNPSTVAAAHRIVFRNRRKGAQPRHRRSEKSHRSRISASTSAPMSIRRPSPKPWSSAPAARCPITRMSW